jgi:hypothetical protein
MIANKNNSIDKIMMEVLNDELTIDCEHEQELMLGI